MKNKTSLITAMFDNGDEYYLFKNRVRGSKKMVIDLWGEGIATFYAILKVKH